MLITEISSALSGINHAINILKGVYETSKQSEIQAVVIELQSGIIDIQSRVFSLQEQYDILSKSKADIERQLIDERNKNNERENYKLESLGTGFAYKFIKEGSPMHYLCAVCFDSGVKSILHRFNGNMGRCCACLKDGKHTFFE